MVGKRLVTVGNWSVSCIICIYITLYNYVWYVYIYIYIHNIIMSYEHIDE